MWTQSRPTGSVIFSPDGKYLASGSNDTAIKIQSTADWNNIGTLTGHSDYVRSITFSPDSKYLASGSEDHTIKIWSTADWSNTRNLTGHADTVNSVAFSPDGKYLASGSSDKTIKIWNIDGALPSHLPKITSTPPLSIQVGESYDYNITAVDEDNDILIFSIIQAPNSISLNSSSGWMHWMPNSTDIGNHTITVRVSDRKGGFDQQTFNVSVIPKPPPEKPRCVITYPANGSRIGGMVTVKGTAVDGSNPITLMQVRIDGANWVNAIGLKNWTVAMGKMNNGKHKIEARAYDGNLYSDTASVDFSVYNPEPLVTVEGASWWIAIIIVLVAIGVIFVAIHQSQRKGPPKGE